MDSPSASGFLARLSQGGSRREEETGKVEDEKYTVVGR